MKTLLTILLLTPLLSFGQSKETKVSFVNHTLTCTLVSFSATAVTQSLFPRFQQSWAVGIVAGMAIGLFHEFLETSPDQMDLVADLVGSCIGVTLTIPLNYKRR